ncbi:MAG: hypothetical protein ACOX7N_00635 [Lawsonibacter sp.]|jgi:hypothetical protein
MKEYQAYMDRQVPNPALVQRLLDLKKVEPRKRKSNRPIWAPWAAAVACFALVFGLWRLSLGLGIIFPSDPFNTPGAGIGSQCQEEVRQQEVMKEHLPIPPDITYQDRTTIGELAASIALPDGSFDVELTQEEIETLIWGEKGRPEATSSQLEEEMWPEALEWEGYELTGRATYDGEGNLFWLHLWGNHSCGADFTLVLAPDKLPPDCLVEPDRETSLVGEVEVTAWARTYDCDGDEEIEYVCGSEFMAGDIGIRFENTGAPFVSEYGGQQNLVAGGAQMFNALLVGYALGEDSGLYLGNLRTNDQIPDWEEREFSSLQDAREEEAFVPYLPQSSPAGYGDFYGRRSYQEGNYDLLWVRWSRGYDDVEVLVRQPVGVHLPQTVDVSRPEQFDVRRYTIPWCDSVPEVYRESVNFPIFQAKDMSLEIVEARGQEKDTGGLSFSFGVLHSNGVVVEYRCDGMEAQTVWSLIHPTIDAEKK